jgi:thymidylate synthase
MRTYLNLLKSVLSTGTPKGKSREGMTETLSKFGAQMRFDLTKGFPLMTTKKMSMKVLSHELLWFMKGETNVKLLLDEGVNIWNEDSYNYYCKVACVNDRKVNSILNPVSLKLNKRGVSKDECDSYSMFTFDEFVEKLQTTSFNDLPKYGRYTLGDCGYQYGKVWRSWSNTENLELRVVDQLVGVILSLKNNPDSRRHIVSSVDPIHSKDLALYWCHSLFQFNCRELSLDERLSILKRIYNDRFGADSYISNVDVHNDRFLTHGFLINRDQISSYMENKEYFANEHVPATTEEMMIELLDFHQIPKHYLDCSMYQRSGDMFLGVPYNIASYSLLTCILAKYLNMVPGEFVHTLGDYHIYKDHEEVAKLQVTRKPYKLPTLVFTEEFKSLCALFPANDKLNVMCFISDLKPEMWKLNNYKFHPGLKAKLITGLR